MRSSIHCVPMVSWGENALQEDGSLSELCKDEKCLPDLPPWLGIRYVNALMHIHCNIVALVCHLMLYMSDGSLFYFIYDLFDQNLLLVIVQRILKLGSGMHFHLLWMGSTAKFFWPAIFHRDAKLFSNRWIFPHLSFFWVGAPKKLVTSIYYTVMRYDKFHQNLARTST